jgi:RNA polymerase sigma-70 factor (ECF subfamily)
MEVRRTALTLPSIEAKPDKGYILFADSGEDEESMPANQPVSDSSGGGRFATTRWSLVRAAGGPDSPEARGALAALCTVYWYPVYVYVRRQGHDADQAEELTQEFFTKLLEKDFLQAVDEKKGKFRAFLMACVRHFLANERDRPRAKKRGGGRAFLSLDFPSAESRYRHEPSHLLTAERLYERQWALTLLDQVLLRLQEEWRRTGRGELFEVLKVCLTAAGRSGSHERLARDCGLTVGAVKVAVHRLRRRYREMLREEIGRLVEDPADIDAEIRDLFTALGGAG